MSIVPVDVGRGLADTINASCVPLAAVTDPWDRALRANQVVAALQKLASIAISIRRAAVLELAAEHGATPRSLASHLGVSKTRVLQLLEGAARTKDGAQ